MAEVLPVTFERTWLREEAPPPARRLLPVRQRRALALGSLALLLAGMTIGMLAWYQPIDTPIVMIASAAPPGRVDARRQLAFEQDASAIASNFTAQRRRFQPQLPSVRVNLHSCLAVLRMAKPHECVVLYVNGVVGSSDEGELVLWVSDAANTPESIQRLSELVDAIDQCRARSTLVLLDLSPARADSGRFPARDLSRAIDAEIRTRKLHNACVITAASPGETAALLLDANESLFGYLVQRGIAGEADGANNAEHHGRVTAQELRDYLNVQVPKLASLSGASQHVQIYGRGASFEVSVAKHVAPHDPVLATEYPAWLVEAWKAFHDASGSLDEASWSAWSAQLHRAEWTSMLSHTPESSKAAQAEVKRFGTAKGPPSATHDAGQQLQTALRQYLSQRADILATMPVDKAKPATQKLLADFIKANAAQASGIHGAATNLACDPSCAKVEHWQAIVELLDSWPKLQSTETSQSLRQLLALRLSAHDEKLDAVACQALRIAARVDRLQGDSITWPWNRVLLDRLLEQRVHAETLLFARGFAELDAAAKAYDECGTQADVLEQTSTRIAGSQSKLRELRQLLQSQRELALSKAELSSAWAESAQGIANLEKLLAPPAQPLASAAEATALGRSLTESSLALDVSSEPLQQLVRPEAIERLMETCRASGSSRELKRMAGLFSSSAIAPSDRQRLWQAYLPVAQHLRSLPLSNTAMPPLASDAFAAQQRMHNAWKMMAEATVPPLDEAAIAAWRDDWQRFRLTELNRLSAPEAALWSIGGVDLVGPFACSSLSRTSPTAGFQFLVQACGDDPQAIEVSAAAPPGLDAIANRQLDATGMARFQLELNSQPGVAEDVRGFLAVVQYKDRRFHAPIRFPQLADTAEANIWLSSSATQLQSLERIDLVGAANVFIWIENDAAIPRTLAVNIAGVPAPLSVALAPHEVKCVPLPALTAPLTMSELAISVQATDPPSFARRAFAVRSPRVEELIDIVAGQVVNDPQQGIALNILVERLPELAMPVPVQLQIDGNTVASGRMNGLLTNELSSVNLSATLKSARAGDRITCRIEVPGAQQPLVLAGSVPGTGAMALLSRQTDPTLALSSEPISQPRPDYALQINAVGNQPESVKITLMPAEGPQTPALSRTVTRSALQASVAATNPPGGLRFSCLAKSSAEIFDTSGLVGKFVWCVDAKLAGGQVTHADQPVVFDDSPPEACRFVQPPATAAKGSQIELMLSGWDSLSGITDVSLFIGRPANGQTPAGAKLVSAAPRAGEADVWSGLLNSPSDLGPCEITARFTNGAGLATFVTTTVNVVAGLPTSTGTVKGIVLEGSRPQPGLEVTLEKGTAALAKAKTDASGAFAFSGVAPGDYVVKATKPVASRKGQTNAKVEAGATATASIKLAL